MSVHRKGSRWAVRYRDEGQRNRSRSFDRKGDADQFDAEITRRRQLGTIAQLDAGKQTLDEFVTQVWAPTHGITLAPKTRRDYAAFYDHHIAPTLGPVALKAITSEAVARWQADRLAAGAGPVALRRAFDLLGSVLQLAFEHERIQVNPVRRVRKARLPRRDEIQPLAPSVVERLRAACGQRDAALLSVMAYAGLRPGEALGLRWADVRENTVLVQRSIALGAEGDTKTSAHRTVRLLSPLRTDLDTWSVAQSRPSLDTLVFPSQAGEPWSLYAYQSWRRRAFDAARAAAGAPKATPYTLRHSFASLLLHEGRSVIYVARQMGHDARLTLTTYGHVIDELEDQPRVAAEEAIRQARVPSQFPGPDSASGSGGELSLGNPRSAAALREVELAGLEPATSWVRSRHSPN